MNRKELLELHSHMSKQAKAIMVLKNQDYANETDPFKNFRAAQFLGVDPGIALLMRVMDKISRLVTYWETGGQLKAESVEDAELDIINYVILHAGLRGHECPPSSGS